LLIMMRVTDAATYESGDWSTVWWLPEQASAPQSGRQVAIAGTEAALPHLIFVPAGTPPVGGWPLLVFLHGQGESSGASPLASVALQGPPQTAGRHPSSMPFVVLSPQKPLTSEFFTRGVSDSIVGLIDKYVSVLGLDPSRVYLTGLSQGGIGTWGLASDERFASRFAAIAPVCGGFVRGDVSKRAQVLESTPVWAFHGDNDSILPVSLSDESIRALKSVPRTAPLKYSRIDEAPGQDYAWAAAGVPTMEGHASWVHAYYPPGSSVGHVPLYDWLLSFSREHGKRPSDASATGPALGHAHHRGDRAPGSKGKGGAGPGEL